MGCTPCAATPACGFREVYPAANASSGLLARFSPHLELSMQGEPTSVQGPCCREVIIEGQEQLPVDGVVAGKFGGAFELRDERIEHAVLVVRCAEIT
jgi:hypothetical protein